MKLYGSIDLHSNNSFFAIKDKASVVIARRKLSKDLNQIFLFLKPFKKQLTGLIIDSTFNWYWLVDALNDANYQVHLANTKAIQQYSGLKYSDDNRDTDWLAEMLRLDILPEGYISPKEQ